jgi:hypothetical protein
VVEYNDDYGEWLDDDLAFRKAFRGVPESKIEETKARIKRYVMLVYRIYDRITEDPVLYERFKQRLEEESQNDKK